MPKKNKPQRTKHHSSTKKAVSLKKWLPPNTYYAQTMPGLEQLAWREIEQDRPQVKLLGFETLEKKNGLLLFQAQKADASLLNLRTVEDIFLVLTSHEKLPRSRDSLARLALLLEQVHWPTALKVHRDITGYSPKAGKQTTFRIISRLFGRYNFHRKEAQFRAEKAVQKLNLKWALVEDGGVLEIWLNLFGGQQESKVIAGLRLSDSHMRHRTYKLKHLPASLRPTVAAAMVMLSEPQDDDIFLDPMCGAGTILIERAYWGRYRHLLGGDIDAQALAVTHTNVGSKYKPITVQKWDARHLQAAIEDKTVTKVVCNLPFGKQIGILATNEQLYTQFLDEAARVLRPGGKMVLLSSDFTLLRCLLGLRSAFKILEEISLTLLGMQAKIFVIRRM